MKYLLTVACVSSLVSVFLYPMLMLGSGRSMSLLLESGFLLSGVAALYMLIRYRKSL